MGRMVAPEEFWIQLWAGVNVVGASPAVAVSQWTGYRWLAEVGGPAALGLEWTGCRHAGRRSKGSVFAGSAGHTSLGPGAGLVPAGSGCQAALRPHLS